MLAAFGRRDMDALLEEADPEIQVRPAVVGGLEGTVYRGHAGVRSFVADLDETWRLFRVETEEFRDLGDTACCASAAAQLLSSFTTRLSRKGPRGGESAGWVRLASHAGRGRVGRLGGLSGPTAGGPFRPHRRLLGGCGA